MLGLVTKTWTFTFPFYFARARVVSSVEGREKVVRLKPDLYDLKWVQKCPFKKRIFTEKELRGLVSYCPILFFFSIRGFPNSTGLSTSMVFPNLFLLLTPGVKFLKQLPNLIPKVTYLSHKKKMHKCIIVIVGISNRAGINMKRKVDSPAGTSSKARSSFSLGSRSKGQREPPGHHG